MDSYTPNLVILTTGLMSYLRMRSKADSIKVFTAFEKFALFILQANCNYFWPIPYRNVTHVKPVLDVSTDLRLGLGT